MAAAWDAVPKSVLISGWRKTGILPQFQVEELEDSLSIVCGIVEKEKRPMRVSSFQINRIFAQFRTEDAKAKSEEYIQSLSRKIKCSTAPKTFYGNVEKSRAYLQK